MMLSLLALAVGLAMDAFAVSLVRGATAQRSAGRAFEVAFAFGLAQGLMPLIGWAVGVAFAGLLDRVGHWIAFGLLGFLGLRMIREAFGDEPEAEPAPGHHLRGLAIASLATSIDAAAAGITLPMLGLPVVLSCAVIGAVTAILCLAAFHLGALVPSRHGRYAEIFGGLVLIGLGTKILAEGLA